MTYYLEQVTVLGRSKPSFSSPVETSLLTEGGGGGGGAGGVAVQLFSETGEVLGL